ncbi:MAG: hypothetical protein HW400_971 [Candidatus Levybacteria bacterium]|nr:hypothetical protein [Candidatus Levybacteria bacterium]
MNERIYDTSEILVSKPEALKIAVDTAKAVPFPDTITYINKYASHYPQLPLTRIQFGLLLEAAAITTTERLTDSHGKAVSTKKGNVVRIYEEAFKDLGVAQKDATRLVDLGIDYCIEKSYDPEKKEFLALLNRVIAEKEKSEKIPVK